MKDVRHQIYIAPSLSKISIGNMLKLLVPSSHTQNCLETLVMEGIYPSLIASENWPAFSSIQEQRYSTSRVHLSFGLKRQGSIVENTMKRAEST